MMGVAAALFVRVAAGLAAVGIRNGDGFGAMLNTSSHAG
jgi:hypothetical protein